MVDEIEAILEKHKEHIPVKIMAELLAVTEVTCKWKPHGQYGWIIVSDHVEAEARNRNDIKNRPYCTVCGKRIKISEVE